MAEAIRVELTLFGGPNLHAPFAAVAADFPNPFPSPLPAEKVKDLCAELLPQGLRERLELAPGDCAFEQLAAALANAIQDLNGPNGLPVQVKNLDNGASRILLGYQDVTATTRALRAGLDLAAAVFRHAAGRPVAAQAISKLLQQMTAVMRAYQPDFIARALIRNARDRGIPVLPVSPGSRTWLYGQGRAGFHFFEAANHRDSLTGGRLARDKYLSNQLVKQLGFRGVVHGIADSERAAAQIARQIGFPVVVKPVDGGKGRGVTAHILTEEQLQGVFAKAAAVSPKRVIVERHVAGDDHRIAVFGGKFAWASRRSPPTIMGDGTHTIAELIDIENQSRSDATVAAGFATRITVDTDMRELLGRQGIALQDRPAAGASVVLRSIANSATGGTVTDCTAAIHPDNRDMAEAIARGFRLDAAGIDFLTTDIGKSWRETDCAVTEVNPTPGISFEVRAEVILRDKFPDGEDGRIPTIVVIGGDSALRERVAKTLATDGRRVGQTDGTVTLMAGQPRIPEGATTSLPGRVTALLLDPTCDALVVSATRAEIERQGFPLDRCDLALISGPDRVTKALRRLIEQCAATVVDAAEKGFDRKLTRLVEAVVTRRAPPAAAKSFERKLASLVDSVVSRKKPR